MANYCQKPKATQQTKRQKCSNNKTGGERVRGWGWGGGGVGGREGRRAEVGTSISFTNNSVETNGVFPPVPFTVSCARKVYYTPGNQQCRNTLQLRAGFVDHYLPILNSCVLILNHWPISGVLHCRSLPTYFKLLYLLSHSSKLIHPYNNGNLSYNN